jgi:hypothetical protein
MPRETSRRQLFNLNGAALLRLARDVSTTTAQSWCAIMGHHDGVEHLFHSRPQKATTHMAQMSRHTAGPVYFFANLACAAANMLIR